MSSEFEAMTRVLYAAVSAPAGQRSWDAMRTLFHPAARLVRTGVDESGASFLRAMSVDEYIANVEVMLTGIEFSEMELWSEATVFGNVARLTSVYEFTRRSSFDDEHRGRGVNFFTLVRDEGRWQITSIVWDNEREGVSLDAAGLAPSSRSSGGEASRSAGAPTDSRRRERKLSWDEVPDEIVNPSMIRRIVTGDRLTVARIRFKDVTGPLCLVQV